MQPNKLHIIAFDVPYPADYGGAIDLYYKLKALWAAGTEIYLHCFQYGRQQSGILKHYCKEVWYYPRKTGAMGLSTRLPYIVYSRRNKDLLERLQQIKAPILFEGVHTTYYLNHPSLANRIKIIRTHNIEHDYYAQLAKKEPNPFKRLFFSTEAKRLKQYEYKLGKADVFMPLSITDTNFFQNIYPEAKHRFIAPFHPYDEVRTKPGKGSYCLYHGNLNHPENREALLFLLKEVFPYINVPVVVAGRKPAADIIEACRLLPNCELVANPNITQMEQLITEAQIHILPTFQPAGMKLKLLYALFQGRHVIVNEAMVQGTGLQNCCIVAKTATEIVLQISSLKDIAITEEDIALRRTELKAEYSNTSNAEKILTYLQR